MGKIKTVVLSAGHGGRDPGAVANGLRESDFNLAVVLATRDYLLTNYTGVRVVLPRDADTYVSLPARRDIAIRVDADLYVSCHANSFRDPSANGFETFVHSGPLYAETHDYRDAIHSAIYRYMHTLGVRDRGRKRADHWVTRSMPCPTVLVEYFFVSSPQEAALGKQPRYIAGMGEATAKGIAEALGLPKKGLAPQTENGVWFRVVAGSYRNRHNAEAATDLLRSQGISAFIDVFRE